MLLALVDDAGSAGDEVVDVADARDVLAGIDRECSTQRIASSRALQRIAALPGWKAPYDRLLGQRLPRCV
ncbi:hypothetical protein S58_60960 [Bradyrhizobium oligotrophicum S58]|uniref:Uncharacterized protein n=1 Tax=Bradyrhizobium oligotrophicum S58 TaxID=1245469 RepID=M4ZF03_9BRAD|nr:hypothetical protein S58_60960 [Bradyrhizobium oligotrophicum S58]